MSHAPAGIKPLSAREKRAARRARDGNVLDMNLVSLIDVFTILIFFLLSSAAGVETLISPKAVKLPEAHAQQLPQPSRVLVIGTDALVLEGRPVMSLAQALAEPGDTLPALQQALEQLPRPAAAAPAQASAAPPAPTLTLMGDKALPYTLLRRVMNTCAAAGYGELQLAVRQAEGA